MKETPTSRSRWFGFERVRVDYKNHAVDITVGSETAWDRSHLRRLRQSSDLPGHVPVIDADVSSEGRPYVVTAAMDEQTLAEQLASDEGVTWTNSTGIAEAVARATHEAHERGLFHGSLSPSDVYVIGDEIAVDGIGLTRGGDIPTDRHQWVAPEVLAGDAPTARSDVYSLGKLLEAALGDSVDLAPRSVKRLIMWSSSDTPDARPRSASEFAEILSDGLGETKSSFRPAFIPTIRANNLTADAEKAIADSPADAPLAATSTGEVEIESNETDTSEDPTEEFEIAIDDDTTEQLEVIDLDDVESDPEDQETDEEDIDLTKDETDDADSKSSGLLSKAAAAGGLTAAAALAASKIGGGDDDDNDGAEDSADTNGTASTGTDGKSAESKSETEAEAPETGSNKFTAADKNASDQNAIDDAETDSLAKKATASETTEKLEKTKASTTGNLEKKNSDSDDDKTPFSYDDEKDEQGLIRFLVPALILLSIPLLAWALLRSSADSETSSAAVATTEESSEAETEEADEPEAAETPEDTDETEEADEPEAAETPEDTDEADEPEAAETPEDTEEADEPEAAETPEDTEEADEPEAAETPEDTDEADEPEAAETPEDTDETEEADSSSEAIPVANQTINASEAAVQVIHGIPATPVDVYVDGELAAPGFEPQSIAGPVDLAAGWHDITIYAAVEDPAATTGDRTDDPVLDDPIAASDGPVAVVAHLDDEGTPMLSTFTENLTPLQAGETRVAIRNLAPDTGVATIEIDGEEQTATLSNGDELEIILDAGEYNIALLDEDGDTVHDADLDLVEGELTTVGFIGSPADSSETIVVQRYSGLSSAPTAVPTGDSGLLDSASGSGGAQTVLGLMLMLLLSGAMIAFRRRKMS